MKISNYLIKCERGNQNKASPLKTCLIQMAILVSKKKKLSKFF